MKLQPRQTPAGEYIVDVLFNGSVLGTLLLDTGSSDVMVDPVFAQALGFAAAGAHKTVATGNGPVQCPVYTVASLAVGNLERTQLDVLVNPHAKGDGYNGLLGRSFFAGSGLVLELV